MEFRKKGVYFGSLSMTEATFRTAGDMAKECLPTSTVIPTRAIGNGARSIKMEHIYTKTQA